MEEKIRKFLEQETGHRITDTAVDLIATGIIDSFSMMKLIAFVESEFGVVCDMEELSPEDFNSVAAISTYVAQCRK